MGGAKLGTRLRKGLIYVAVFVLLVVGRAALGHLLDGLCPVSRTVGAVAQAVCALSNWDEMAVVTIAYLLLALALMLPAMVILRLTHGMPFGAWLDSKSFLQWSTYVFLRGPDPRKLHPPPFRSKPNP